MTQSSAKSRILRNLTPETRARLNQGDPLALSLVAITAIEIEFLTHKKPLTNQESSLLERLLKQPIL